MQGNATFRRWMECAWEDLKASQVMLKEGIFNQVCFHSQQCIEKCLKAFLAFHGRIIPKIHALPKLLIHCRKLQEDFLKEFDKEFFILDQYYRPTRYPDAVTGSLSSGLPGRKEALESLEVAEQVYDMISKRYKS